MATSPKFLPRAPVTFPVLSPLGNELPICSLATLSSWNMNLPEPDAKLGESQQLPSLRSGKGKTYWPLAKGCCVSSLTGPQKPAQGFSPWGLLVKAKVTQQKSSQIIWHPLERESGRVLEVPGVLALPCLCPTVIGIYLNAFRDSEPITSLENHLLAGQWLQVCPLNLLFPQSSGKT